LKDENAKDKLAGGGRGKEGQKKDITSLSSMRKMRGEKSMTKKRKGGEKGECVKHI